MLRVLNGLELISGGEIRMDGEALDVMRQLALEGMTMLVATHEMGFVRAVAQRVLFMNHGEIVRQDSPAPFFDASSGHGLRHRQLQKFLCGRVLSPDFSVAYSSQTLGAGCSPPARLLLTLKSQKPFNAPQRATDNPSTPM